MNSNLAKQNLDQIDYDYKISKKPKKKVNDIYSEQGYDEFLRRDLDRFPISNLVPQSIPVKTITDINSSINYQSVNSDLFPSLSNTYNIGSSNKIWNSIFVSSIGDTNTTIDIDNIADLSTLTASQVRIVDSDHLFDAENVEDALTELASGGLNGLYLQIANNLSDLDDAATARVNLGVEIGVDVQAYDATLQSISSLGTAADRMIYTTGVDTWAESVITSFTRTLLDDATAADARTTLGLGALATQGDGDKGDITVSASGATWTIDNLAVTNAKIATGIDAVKVADGSVTNAEFQGLTTLTGGGNADSLHIHSVSGLSDIATTYLKLDASNDPITGDLSLNANLIFDGTRKIIGGTGTTSDLSLQTTSGIGTTGADMHFLVGNNGATEAMTILNDGSVGIGNVAPSGKLHITGTADDQQFIVQANATQTANLTEWQNSSATVLGAVGPTGNLGFGVAPSSLFKGYFSVPQAQSTTSSMAVRGEVLVGGDYGSNIGVLGQVYAYQDNTRPISTAPVGVNGVFYHASGTSANGIAVRAFGQSAALSITLTNFYGLNIADFSKGAGSTLTNQYGLYIDSLTSGGTLNYAVYTNTGINRFGDEVRIEADSKSLKLGAGLDATILYDGTNLLINPKLVGSGYVNIQGKILVDTEVEIDGALNHDGSTIGFNASAPVAQSTGWAVSNVTTDKVFDANATTLDEVADVLGTLITYLISRGDLAA